MTGTPYAGTWRLVRQHLRRDRFLVITWTLVLLLVCYASAAATASLYPAVSDQVAAAEAINRTPAIVALYGPILDVRSLGELAMTKMTVLYAAFVAALFVVLVRRHTRSEEESGQAELLGGTGVGGRALLAAAVLESSLVAVVLGLLTAVVNIAGGLPVLGSFAFGGSWAGIALVATGIAGVACQVSASARTCGMVASAVLGVAYLLRAVGDTTVGWLSWLSPFGWSTQLRAYSGTRWWVLGLFLGLALALVLLAQVLRGVRDLGSGLVEARPGPATGSARLSSVAGLAVRMHQTSVLVWSSVSVTMGLVLGAIVPNVSDLLDSPASRDLIQRLGGEGAIERALIAAELSIFAVVVSCLGIAVVAHAATDEQAGRTEQVLATCTSRAASFAATTAIAVVGVLWLLLVTGASVALGYGVAGGDLTGAVRDVVPAALAQAPAAWVLVALAALAFALDSSWTVAAWVLVAAFVTVGQVGELLDLPAWVLDLSPYTHVPPMPVEGFEVLPEAGLLLAATVLLVAARWRYGRRDIG